MLNWIVWNRTVLTLKLCTYAKVNCLQKKNKKQTNKKTTTTNKLFICIKMDLALNNQQMLICHKTEPNRESERLDFELVYYDVSVQHVSHYTIGATLCYDRIRYNISYSLSSRQRLKCQYRIQLITKIINHMFTNTRQFYTRCMIKSTSYDQEEIFLSFFKKNLLIFESAKIKKSCVAYWPLIESPLRDF